MRDPLIQALLLPKPANFPTRVPPLVYAKRRERSLCSVSSLLHLIWFPVPLSSHLRLLEGSSLYTDPRLPPIVNRRFYRIITGATQEVNEQGLISSSYAYPGRFLIIRTLTFPQAAYFSLWSASGRFAYFFVYLPSSFFTPDQGPDSIRPPPPTPPPCVYPLNFFFSSFHESPASLT